MSDDKFTDKDARDFLQNREKLQRVMRLCDTLAQDEHVSIGWRRTYADLSQALNVLDAHWGRATLKEELNERLAEVGRDQATSDRNTGEPVPTVDDTDTDGGASDRVQTEQLDSVETGKRTRGKRRSSSAGKLAAADKG